MGVLVEDDGEGVLVVFDVEADEDVVAVRRFKEQAAEMELAFGKIGLGFERLEAALIAGGEDLDGGCGAGVVARKQGLEDPAHALELIEEMTAFLLARVRVEGEVGAGNLDPLRCRGAGKGWLKEQEEKQESGERMAFHGVSFQKSVFSCE